MKHFGSYEGHAVWTQDISQNSSPPVLKNVFNFDRIDLSNYELDWLEIFFRGKVHVYISMKKLCGAHSSSQKIRKPHVHFFVTDFPGNVYAPHLPEDRDIHLLILTYWFGIEFRKNPTSKMKKSCEMFYFIYFQNNIINRFPMFLRKWFLATRILRFGF